MAKKGDAKILRFVVLFLRQFAGMFQEDFGKAARVAQGTVSEFEAGKTAPKEEALRRMASVARVPWPVVVLLRRFLTAMIAWLESGSAPAVAQDDAAIEQAAVDAVRLAMIPYRLEEERLAEEDRPPEEERREADEIWTALEAFPIAERRRWIELSIVASESWALAERICHASEDAASDDVDAALELADLALSIAGRVPGGEARRAKVQAYCWGFVGNARKVATAFSRADQAFARTWELWQVGTPSLLPLAEWRLLDREASLRREQHRYHEALERLDRAQAVSGKGPFAIGRILTNRANVLEQMGDHKGALAVLEEAAAAIEASSDSQLLFGLRFNTAVNLCYLERFAEAENLLPEVRALAAGQGRKLDSIRVNWLAAKLAAGQGRREEAKQLLDQVIVDFKALDLAYEAALASLDLALLYLEDGRGAEVQELALSMGWIFEAMGITREALAAFTLFREAAEQETATVELVKRVIRVFERTEG